MVHSIILTLKIKITNTICSSQHCVKDSTSSQITIRIYNFQPLPLETEKIWNLSKILDNMT